MTKIFALIALIVTLSSCGKEGTDLTTPNNKFSFEKREVEFTVSENMDHFIIKGSIDRQNDDSKIDIVINEDKTTAILNEHYILPEKLEFFFPTKTTNSELSIQILKDNIKEPVDISFTTPYKLQNRDYVKHIDTVVVRLIPDIKR